jgi:uncharacterized metal-binding protein YceD (DUF177 family)
MLQIAILGMEDGDHPFSCQAEAGQIDGMFEEFTGTVQVHGIVRRQGKRLWIEAHAKCMANLICDISGNPFTEQISAPIQLAYRVDTHLFLISEQPSEGDEILIREDERFIDLTEEARQELAIHLPMKRLAPEYRDKTFEELYPAVATAAAEDEHKEEELPGDPWAALRGLKLNNN